jgi:5'-nucleotidase
MKIMLTNDDGINAPGIKTLKKVLEKAGHEIIVIAPTSQQSASSHSITLHKPLRIIKKSANEYAVSGSPADCVILASRVILKEVPDLVISGINGGQNMAEDILYSGTVAAALEAMFMGYRAIAVSISSYSNQKFITAAEFMQEFISGGLQELIGKNEVFNINVPNLSRDKIKGVKITRVGNRHYKDFVREDTDQHGGKIFWIGGAKPLWQDVEGSDFKALYEDYVSITPISPNFTVEESLPKIREWIERVNFK